MVILRSINLFFRHFFEDSQKHNQNVLSYVLGNEGKIRITLGNSYVPDLYNYVLKSKTLRRNAWPLAIIYFDHDFDLIMQFHSFLTYNS